MNANQIKLLSAARSYLGVRWQHQGRTRAGIDCIGLVIKSAHDAFGWTYDVADYDRQARDESMIIACRELMVPIRRTELQPADVVVVAFDSQRHAALIGDYPGVESERTILHAHAINRKVVEQRFDNTWKSRVIGAFRFPEVQ